MNTISHLQWCLSVLISDVLQLYALLRSSEGMLSTVLSHQTNVLLPVEP